MEQPERINLKPEAARMIIRICVEAILRAQSRRNQEQTAAQVAPQVARVQYCASGERMKLPALIDPAF
ncbi:MAG: hypothetical protein ACYCYO_18270 [Bacilli bacterium]